MKSRGIVFSGMLLILPYWGCIEWSDPVEADGALDGLELLDLDLPESDCPPGQAWCEGECVDVLSSHDRCGGCNVVCEPYEVCADGVCSMECPAGRIACGGSCVDITSDVNNCGACGRVCTAGENADPLCEDRICTVRCHEGWADLDGDGACESSCTPSSETESCNGVDDNCDGSIDEGFDCRMGMSVSCTTACGSAGTGTCGLDCRAPSPESCDPPDEICNGEDDDCDERCDNGFDCCRGLTDFCTTDCGSAGLRNCTSTCMWSDCLPPPETCNGVDDDCDGSCDNGFDCCRNEAGTCTTSCGSTGSRVCSSSCGWGTCTPPAESCNGQDDDCDGSCDNGHGCCAGSSGTCTTSCGSTGSRVCSSSCSWGTCTPPAESCNGSDDDCDGSTDEDFWQYRCPFSDVTYPALATCNSACIQSSDCTLVAVSAGGSIVYQNCDWDYNCSPNYDVGRIRGSGNQIIFERSYNSNYYEVGRATLTGATASGSIVYKNCDWDYNCSPNYEVGRIRGSGNQIIFERSYNSNYYEVGRITLSGATAGGSIVYKNCDWDYNCSPNYEVGRIRGLGNQIIFERSYNSNYYEVGRITLTPTSYTCPLGASYTCSGTPPSCSAPQSCETITVCP